MACTTREAVDGTRPHGDHATLERAIALRAPMQAETAQRFNGDARLHVPVIS